MYIYIFTYIHTCTYLHTFIHTCLYAYIIYVNNVNFYNK